MYETTINYLSFKSGNSIRYIPIPRQGTNFVQKKMRSIDFSSLENLRKRNVRTETASIAYMQLLYGLPVIASVALTTTRLPAYRHKYPSIGNYVVKISIVNYLLGVITEGSQICSD